MSQSGDSQMFRKLSAIMFSDIVGYSRKMGENESVTMKLLNVHDQIMRPAIEHFEGKVIKTGGDSYMASFDSAVNAVRCAIKVQEAFVKFNKGKEAKHQVWLRIGIHLGDVVIRGNDMFGDGVNIASRLEPIAEPGGICISQDVLNQVKNKIEIEHVALGARELKNIANKIDLYKIVIDAQDEHLDILRKEAANKAAQDQGPGQKNKTTQPSRLPPWPVIAAVVAVLLLAALIFKGIQNKNKKNNGNEEKKEEGGKPEPAMKHQIKTIAILPVLIEVDGVHELANPTKWLDQNKTLMSLLKKELNKDVRAFHKIKLYTAFEVFDLISGGPKLPVPQDFQKLPSPTPLQVAFAKTVSSDAIITGILNIKLKSLRKVQIKGSIFIKEPGMEKNLLTIDVNLESELGTWQNNLAQILSPDISHGLEKMNFEYEPSDTKPEKPSK